MTAHLSNEEFFTRLAALFEPLRQKSHGSVYLTQKRLSRTTNSSSSTPNPATSSTLPTPPETPGADIFTDLSPAQPLPILIRATNGKSKPHRQSGEKVKISTIVESEKIDGFFVRYAEVCRAGMSGLKKRDKKKKRAKERVKKKKGVEREKKS